MLRRDGQRVLGHTFLRGSIVKQYDRLCTRPIAFAYTEISARGVTAATMVLVWCVGERSFGASWTMVWPSLLVCGLQLGEIGIELLSGPVYWGRSIGGKLACAAYTICLVYCTCYPVLPPQELLPFNRCAACPGRSVHPQADAFPCVCRPQEPAFCTVAERS